MGSESSEVVRTRTGRMAGRIPLHRQPPIWLMIAVVLATVAPLTMHLLAPATASGTPASSLMIEPAVKPIATVVRVLQPTPTLPVVATAATEVEHVELTTEDASEPEPEPEPELAERRTQRATGTAKQPTASPQLLTKATSACREGDKKTARSTYRELPVGDTRRREIRKACRREGVWIL